MCRVRAIHLHLSLTFVNYILMACVNLVTVSIRVHTIYAHASAATLKGAATLSTRNENDVGLDPSISLPTSSLACLAS